MLIANNHIFSCTQKHEQANKYGTKRLIEYTGDHKKRSLS